MNDNAATIRPTDARVCIVLLAAGAASRFGSPKQMADIDGVAMIRHCAKRALRTGARVVVVTGAHREMVEQELSDLDVTLTRNDEWRSGMGGSISCGVRAAAAGDISLDAVLILLGDQPAVSTEHLLDLVRRHHERPDCIAASKANDVLGPPCIFPRQFFNELANLRASGGAREVILRYPNKVIGIELPEAGIDIDSPADHAKFRASRMPA